MSDPESNEPQHGAAALEAARRVKLRKIQEMGIDPWGHRFDNHTAIGQIRARENEIVAEPAAEPGKPPEASMGRRSGRRGGSCSCAGPGS